MKIIRRFMIVLSIALSLPIAVASCVSVPGISKEYRGTSDPAATEDTVSLLRWLYTLPDRPERRFLSGQDIGTYDARQGYYDYIQGLEKRTGTLPAMIATDYYADIDQGFFLETDSKTSILLDYWNAGGLISVHAHMPNPWTGGGVHDTAITDGLYEDAYTPGTDAYGHLQQQFDALADQFLLLQDSGAVVLFRPFHEANGGWFWWYSDNPEQFKALWRCWHAYLSEQRGVHNLLYVYSPSPVPAERLGSRGPGIYYPGGEYVDIVGLDLYRDNLRDMPSGNYTTLVRTGKPFAFGELGGPFPPTGKTKNWDLTRIAHALETYYPETVYWLTWSSWEPDGVYAMEELPGAEELFNHPLIASIEDVDFRRSPKETGSVPADAETGNELRIGCIGFSTGMIYGKPDYFEDACRSLEERMGGEWEIIRIRGLYGYRLSGAVKRLVEDEGCRIIILDQSPGNMKDILNTAEKWKDTFFIIESYDSPPEQRNVITYGIDADGWHYLTGIIAGCVTGTDRIGYLAWSDADWSIRRANLFSRGVAEVNAEARVLFTLCAGDVTQTIEKLLGEGCDIFNAAAGSPEGIKELADRSEPEKPLFAFSRNVHSSAVPEVIICSQPEDRAGLWSRIIDDILSGGRLDTPYRFGMNDGVIRLGSATPPINPMVEVILRDAVITLPGGKAMTVYDYLLSRYDFLSTQSINILGWDSDTLRSNIRRIR